MPSPDDEKNGEGISDSPDWGEVFGDLVCHTSITHSEIPYLTLPQINNYRRSIGRNIPIKIGIPNMFGSSSTPSPSTPQEESTQEDVESFFNGF